MNTPILDFVEAYRASGTARLHMPGHKGQSLLGFEGWDITEIQGADELYEAEGIIAESEANATALFGSGRTFYSTEGSSQCIRAMLRLALIYGRRTGKYPPREDMTYSKHKRPVILAARNVHKAFVYAAALLDLDVQWIYPDTSVSLCSCPITPEHLNRTLTFLERDPSAPIAGVYITSPDYLGNLAAIPKLAEVCHRHHTLLLVDNAHGAYLHFLQPSLHPLDLGCDICCDSAHKTLPVLTGGAYLHISSRISDVIGKDGKNALALFGSTSPSYLIMASLDRCNSYLADGYRGRLTCFCRKLDQVREALRHRGWQIEETDPLRITLRVPGTEDLSENSSPVIPPSYNEACTKGSSSRWLKDALRSKGIEFEYGDDEYIVFMLTPENTDRDLEKLLQALGTNSLPYKEKEQLPVICSAALLTIREAIFSDHVMVPVEEARGQICASPAVSCPPAIPIVISGEIINGDAVEMFKHYHIDMVDVVRYDTIHTD